jgi:hypothetical protein
MIGMIKAMRPSALGIMLATATGLADANLWIGRPWLENQAHPFDLQRPLGLSATTPF